ncbi:hypothetical protein MSSD14B_19500 [Marinobacter salsuginis]|uniref:Uncharacterized protein n=1 Tax=Marinobacter salsuginis TaxID=418719 RepID=A0A5M3PZN3_9GAMM|nr:hypothetical protein MSSD14B_19500 [Marinobacter salsuginis]GHD51608.1 hypothetical protein GCM10008110_23520 [Marinobacter persicus]
MPIQAPETPSATSTSGPRQQAEAKRPAIPPAAKGTRPDLEFGITLTPFMVSFDEIRLLP